jgi:methylmalonyl-CoA mutase N-terminal domain/subunit
MQRQIADAAYRMQTRVESGARVVVGVNRFQVAGAEIEITKLSPKAQDEQIEAVRRVRAERSQAAVDAALERLRETASGTGNLMHPLKAALAAYATIGECCDVLRGVFGEYRAPDVSG